MRDFIACTVGVLACLWVSAAPAIAQDAVDHFTVFAGVGPCPGLRLKADFAAGQGRGLYCRGAQNYPTPQAIPGASVSRASSKSCDYTSGLIVQVTSNVPCITDKGVLIEGSRTNSIRNSVAGGAAVGVIGTGGAFPTNWQNQITDGAVTYRIAGTGTENGLGYVDWRINGTASNNFTNLFFESPSQIVALPGQIWTGSYFVRVVAGSTANITGFRVVVYDSDGTLSPLANSATSYTPTTSMQRVVVTRTLANPSTTRVILGATLTYSVGAVLDITLRFYGPQLEQAPTVSSFIATTTAAATRAADAMTYSYAPMGSSAVVLYGTGNAISIDPTSPIDLGASSGGVWTNDFVRSLTVVR